MIAIKRMSLFIFFMNISIPIYSINLKEASKKVVLPATMLAGGLALTGISFKLLKENYDNYKEYLAECAALETLGARVKDSYQYKIYGDLTERTHTISLELPKSTNAENYDQIKKQWDKITTLHRYNNGSHLILPWTLSGASVLLLLSISCIKHQLN